MALLIRTSQSAEFVHISDTEAILPADGATWPGPSPHWLPAAGQPEGCTRMRIRCLSADEVAEVRSMHPPEDASDEAQMAAARRRHARIVDIAWLAMDGQPPPKDLGYGWTGQIAALIEDVTVAGPLGRRP